MSEQYEQYDQYDYMDERRYAKSHLQPRENILMSSRGLKKPPGWVFISRKADIGIILVLLLGAGLGMMWFISQLPFFLETASVHYLWAKELYATWGTPSMRWLFINLVVGVIVATSGLLSAFGGDSGEDVDRAGYVKGRVYGSSHSNSYSGIGSASMSASSSSSGITTRFNGTGYESPVYTPFLEPLKLGLNHQNSFGAWNYSGEERIQESEGEREGEREEEIQESQAPVQESYSAPSPSAGAISREIAVSSEIQPSREIPMSEDIPMSGEIPVSGEIPMSSEMPMANEIPVSREIPSPDYVPEPEVSEVNNGIAPRGAEAVEIISKIYDPIPEPEETAADDGHSSRMDIVSSAPLILANEPPHESSPPKPELLPKSHTFTIGRVIRRDQVEEYLEPLSLKLESMGRNVRHDQTRSSNTVSVEKQPKETPISLPLAVSNIPALPQAGLGEGARHSQQVYLPEHRRRHSSESVVQATHRRRNSSEFSLPPEVHYPQFPKLPTTGEAKYSFSITLKQSTPPSPSPLLKQRSIVYPPALLSQASNVADDDVSPPPSPPMEAAIPPPPPPYLKLPPPLKVSDSSSISSSEEHPSFKVYIPPPAPLDVTPAIEAPARPSGQISSNEEKKSSSKHSRNPSTHSPSTPSPRAVGSETGSSSVQQRSLTGKHDRSAAGDQEIQEVPEGETFDRQESSSPKADDLHQQIEDFLAKFHENMRLQRQESLARYKKRLLEPDD